MQVWNYNKSILPTSKLEAEGVILILYPLPVAPSLRTSPERDNEITYMHLQLLLSLIVIANYNYESFLVLLANSLLFCCCLK